MRVKESLRHVERQHLNDDYCVCHSLLYTTVYLPNSEHVIALLEHLVKYSRNITLFETKSIRKGVTFGLLPFGCFNSESVQLKAVVLIMTELRVS